MRVQVEEGVHIWLSRRNLETLLAKLDGHPPDSACTIRSVYNTDGMSLTVTAEPDELHYSERESAGRMHPATEAAMQGGDMSVIDADAVH